MSDPAPFVVSANLLVLAPVAPLALFWLPIPLLWVTAFSGGFLFPFVLVYVTASCQRIALMRLRGSRASISQFVNLDGAGKGITIWAFAFAILFYIFELCTAGLGGTGAAELFTGIVFLFFSTFFMFVPLMIIDQRKSVVAAVSASIDAIRAIFLPAFGMFLLSTFVGVLGVFACCFGELFTLPIMLAYPAVLYNDFYRPEIPAEAPEADDDLPEQP
jgi:hypothetical protein